MFIEITVDTNDNDSDDFLTIKSGYTADFVWLAIHDGSGTSRNIPLNKEELKLAVSKL